MWTKGLITLGHRNATTESMTIAYGGCQIWLPSSVVTEILHDLFDSKFGSTKFQEETKFEIVNLWNSKSGELFEEHYF